MVAKKTCGCWCRLTTSFAVHINVTKIAISTSTWYFDTVKKAQATCANVQTPKSICCQHKRSWCLLHCPVTLPVQMCRLTRVFAARHLRQHKRFCTVTKAKVSLCKCADLPDPWLLAQNGIQSPFETPHESFELWWRLRLDQANVQTRQNHRCSHEWHPKIVGEYHNHKLQTNPWHWEE